MESVSHWHNAIVRINIFAEVEKAILARGIEANLLFFHRRGKRRAKIILEQLQLDFIRVGRKFATFSSLHHHHRQFVRLQVDRKTVRKIKWQWRLDQLCKLYSYPRNDDHFLLFFFSSLDHEHESHSSVFRTKWSLREQHEFFFFPTWKLLSRKKKLSGVRDPSLPFGRCQQTTQERNYYQFTEWELGEFNERANWG